MCIYAGSTVQCRIYFTDSIGLFSSAVGLSFSILGGDFGLG